MTRLRLTLKEDTYDLERLENVEGAKKIGMQGLVYQGNVQELKQLIK